jgi:hypothetical protein
MVKLHIVNPQASTAIEAYSPAPRLASLKGKTIGLYWNVKAGGDLALEHTARLVGQSFPDAQFKEYIGSVGATMRHTTAEDADRIARECDAVVGTTAD